MFSRLPPFVCTSVLAMTVLHCAGSAPAPNTPQQAASSAAEKRSPVEGVIPAVGSTSEESGASAVSRVAGTSGEAESDEPLSDAEIAGIADAAHTAEIAQGRLARDKAKDARVRDFAAMVYDHHAEAHRAHHHESIPAVDSTESERLAQEAAVGLELLRSTSGVEFDQMYLQLQIDRHRRVLDALKTRLIPAAQDESLKARLEEMVPRIESHLALAERLQQELGPTASSSGPPSGSDRASRR